MNLGRKSSGKDVGETGGEDGFSKNTLYTGTMSGLITFKGWLLPRLYKL